MKMILTHTHTNFTPSFIFGLLLSVFFISTSSLQAQPGGQPSLEVKVKAEYDTDGKLHGPYKVYYRDRLQVAGNYEHGERNGDWIVNVSDSVKIIGAYQNNQLEGEWKYFINKRQAVELNFHNNLLQGNVKAYFSNNKPSVEMAYLNGLPNGEQKIYQPDGKLLYSSNYQNGKKNGKAVAYTEQGEEVFQVEYRNGLPYEFSQAKSVDGYLLFTGNLKAGTGTVQIHKSENNTLKKVSEMTLLDGQLNGMFQLFFSNGNTQAKGMFNKGLAIGDWTRYEGDKSEHFTYSESDNNRQDSLLMLASPEQGDLLSKKTKRTPRFPGGDDQIAPFLNQNVEYPAIAKENAWEGTCYVQFTVNEIGEISEAEAFKVVGKTDLKNPKAIAQTEDAIKAASVKAVQKMPFWEPGFQNYLPIKSKVTVPIKFKLNQ